MEPTMTLPVYFEDYVQKYLQAVKYKDIKLREETEEKIYGQLHNLIAYFVSRHYSDSKSDDFRELYQSIWEEIWDSLKYYNHYFGKISTYIVASVKHTICEYTSKKKYHLSAYYGNKLQMVSKIEEQCDENNHSIMAELLSKKMKVKVDTAQEYLNLLRRASESSLSLLPEAEHKAVSVDIDFDEIFSHQSDEERIGLFLREHLSEEDATIFEVYMNSDTKSIIGFCRMMADEFEISPAEMKTKILKARKILRKVSIPDFTNDD